MAKEFTSISILQLIESGELTLTDKLRDYLTDLPPALDAITVEHVLTHTSGFPKVKWHRGINTDDVIQQIELSELQFVPGEGYLYSNLNVVARALLVEAIMGKTYAEVLNERILKPAGMMGSYQQTSESHVSQHLVPGDYPTFIVGVTVYVTPKDLMKFEQAIWSEKLVSTNAIKSLLPGDNLSGKSNRAYLDFGQFFLTSDGKLKEWQHDGSNPSHHTLKYHDLETGLLLVAMSNDGNKSTLYEIKDAVVSVANEY